MIDTYEGWLELFKEDEKYYLYAKAILKFVSDSRKRFKNGPKYLQEWFEWSNVNVPWYELNKMFNRGLLRIGSRSNTRTYYVITNYNDLKRAIKDYEKLKKIYESKPPTNTEKIEGIPKDIFSPIVGFDDIKNLFLISLNSKKPVHILLIGPPATAKSLFLLELARIAGSYYAIGSRTSGAGLSRLLFETRPKILLIDEIDKMASNPNDLSVLLSLMETGKVVETKATRMGYLHLNTRVYAAGNTDQDLPTELKSRFLTLYLHEYTTKEFIEVTTNFLVQREDVSKEIAEYIAKRMVKMTKDVRQARNIARICKTKDV